MKYKNTFIQGDVHSQFIGEAIAKHQTKTNIGAHSLFLGQVRADEVNGKVVTAIEYSAYNDMANKEFYEIKESTFKKFDIICMHIYHSLGIVKAGEVCLFIFISSKRRRVAIKAIEYVVEAVKDKVPVFGKEIFEDESYQWKVN